MPSGNQGTVSIGGVAVSNVLAWTGNLETNQKSRTHSGSAPWQRVDNTNFAFTGNFTIEPEDGEVPTTIQSAIVNNTQVTLALLAKTGGSPYTGPAKIGNAQFEANVDTADIERITFDFASDGTWTIPTE